jgi:hypothetical protein
MKNPLLRWPAVVLAMLSLSIGWGIRGNYGHEFGAMIPGMLCAVAIALFSGREDWRARVPFFAFFGAAGWAFGGSMSYMVTMSYTQSGHLPSQLYGFFVVFAIGFLWASLGGAGTAWAALADRERLTAIYRPLMWVLAIWTFGYFFEHTVIGWYESLHNAGIAGQAMADARQRDPFYWLDSSWLDVAAALAALCAFDLWDTRFRKAIRLAALGAAGALAGWLAQLALAATGALSPLLGLLVHFQGDANATNPATGQPFGVANFVANWPQFLFDLAPHIGWIIGLTAGIIVYFWLYGEFRSGASLLVHMGSYGFLVFLAGPVLLSNVFKGAGGFRMVPPRGDNWAFVLGALIGLIIYMFRNGLCPVGYVALMSGFIGGIGFMTAQMVKILALVPGNPVLTQDPNAIAFWKHYRSANWHNIAAEQGVGLFYGLAVLLPMAVLVTRAKRVDDEPRTRRWTEIFSVAFIMNVLLYVNLIKNVRDWTEERAGGFRAVPERLKAPLLGFWEMSAPSWFTLIFVLITVCTVALLIAHTRRRLAAIPATWLGKGQLFYLAFLWAIVVGNFEKALVGFHEQRLVTEGLFFVNGLIATFLILVYPPQSETEPTASPADYAGIFRRSMIRGVTALVAGILVYTGITRAIYGDEFNGFGGNHRRFGVQADWRVRPLLKNLPHR